MYQVGDKVVYPVHGAGEIVAIESREVGGKLRDYYILELPESGLKVSVPMSEAARLGIRRLMSGRDTERVLQILCGEAAEANDLPEKWNHRSKLLLDKIKTGDACELAEVVHNLAERQRSLASGEKRLFEQARDILLSELKLVGSSETGANSERSQRLQQVLTNLERF